MPSAHATATARQSGRGIVRWTQLCCRKRCTATDLPQEATMKKKLGVMGLLAAVAAALMFWRRNKDDDEFLDEELE